MADLHIYYMFIQIHLQTAEIATMTIKNPFEM